MSRSLVERFSRLLLILLTLSVPLPTKAATSTAPAREIIVNAILAEDDTKRSTILASLSGQGDEAIATLFAAWRADSLFIFTSPDGTKVPVQLTGLKGENDAQDALRIDTGQPLLDAARKPLRLIGSELVAVEHNANLRRAMKSVLDLAEIAHPDPEKRRQAIHAIGFAQAADKIPALEARLKIESDEKVKLALRESLALAGLKHPDDTIKLAALAELAEMRTLSSYDLILSATKAAEACANPKVAAAGRATLHAIDQHRSFVDFFGTLFRSASLGSILLIVALGLAITFGLMGVINMAHGEMIAVGAYTTYLTQAVFGAGITIPCFGLSIGIPGMGLTGWGFQSYFIAAIPLSFLAAAVVGIGLERGIIQFLYRRPLESLLATWGVSLLLKQIFRLTFGATNAQDSIPLSLR